MKKTLHAATWKTTWAKISTITMAVLTVVPIATPSELSAWISEQVPFLPSWAAIGTAAGIGLTRMGIAIWKIASDPKA